MLVSLRFKDFASESRAWQGQLVFKPVFQRASRGPPLFFSRPTHRTISKSGPFHKLNLSRSGKFPPTTNFGSGRFCVPDVHVDRCQSPYVASGVRFPVPTDFVMNPPLTPPRMGTDRTRKNACPPPGVCETASLRGRVEDRVCFLSGDRLSSQRRLPLVGQSLRLQAPMSLSPDGTEGPGNYGLNKECLMAVTGIGKE